jgi:cytochrome c oxidase subunit II
VSTLDPAGRAAEQIAELFVWMAVGGFVIWGATIGLTIYAIYARYEPHDERRQKLLIVGGGIVFPTVTLTGLLIYGLSLLPELVAPAPAGSMKITVFGEQWWWRVQYFAAENEVIELANELRLPVGETVELNLESKDVIHSFWIPSLGGKVDMIPGRKTRLVLTPTRTGVFRGVCAEFCGSAHALMSFDVVVSEKKELTDWLTAQQQLAREPVESLERTGRDLFLANGCGACHAIRGTAARGVLGPDLTHAGSRESLGAGMMANERGTFERWILEPDVLKPGVHMPAFNMLARDEVGAIAAYLESLK